MSKKGQFCISSSLSNTWECTGFSGHFLCLIIPVCPVWSNFTSLFLSQTLSVWCVHVYVCRSVWTTGLRPWVGGLLCPWCQKTGRLDWVDLSSTWSSQGYACVSKSETMGGDCYPSLCAGDNWEKWGSMPGCYWMDCVFIQVPLLEGSTAYGWGWVGRAVCVHGGLYQHLE